MDQEKLVKATGLAISKLTPDYAETRCGTRFIAQVEQRPRYVDSSDVQSKECNAKSDAYQPSPAILRGRQRIRDLDRLQDAVKMLAQQTSPSSWRVAARSAGMREDHERLGQPGRDRADAACERRAR
jgi:hypothetical protein